MGGNEHPASLGGITTDIEAINSLVQGLFMSNSSNGIASTVKTNSASLETVLTSSLGSWLVASVWGESGLTGGIVEIYNNNTGTGDPYMKCSLNGGECKTPIPAPLYSVDGWTVKLQGDGTNNIILGYSFYTAVGYASTTIQNGWDTWIDAYQPTLGHGYASDLELKYIPSSVNRKVLIKHDLSSIGAGTPVNSAVLSLYCNNANTKYQETAKSLRIYGILLDWDESQATYNNRLTGTPWNTPGLGAGTDRDTAPTYQGDPTIVDEERVGFDITTLAREWITNGRDNFGLIMQLETAISTNWFEFNSFQVTNEPWLVVQTG